MYVLIFISHLPLDTTYPLELTIKGEIKSLQLPGFKIDQMSQGFYIRNSTGLTNGKPSWTHENGIGSSIWFANASKSWVVGSTKDIGSSFGYLSSSTSPDNSIPEAKNWEYLDLELLRIKNYTDFENVKWIRSSDISIKRGM